jgi:hypothetical protein
MSLPVAVVLFCLVPGCGDDTGGSGGGTDTDATAGTDSTAGTTGVSTSGAATGSGPTGGTDSGATDSGATDSGGTDTSDTSGATTGGTGEPRPSQFCEDRELPPRGGAEITVSPAANGMVMLDGSPTTLRQVVSDAQSGDTVLLEDGTYTFVEAGAGDFTGVYFTAPNVTLRSVSGNAADVILDSAYGSQGDGSAPITIGATGIVLADLTVTRSVFHLVHIWAEGDDALIHNIRLVDGGQQFLKASVNIGTIDGVEVSCSSFLMTANGRDNVWGYGPQDGSTRCYTGGIDTHSATNWNVHDSYFDGIYCDATGVQRPAHGKSPELRDDMTYNGGLAEHGIHMWDSPQGTGHRIANNRVVNCARGIGIGLTDTVYGTLVINNMVVSEHAGSAEHDVGIIVERAVNSVVAHNSVYLSHVDSYPSAIEYRWDTTDNLTMHGNLTNRDVRARDGAVAAIDTDNVLNAEAGWFADVATADLHLEDCAAPGTAALIGIVADDHDGDMRSNPTVPGADECAP